MELWLISGLLVKHFVMDFPLQLNQMLVNKGQYGQPWGIAHSALHGLGTFWVFSSFGYWTAGFYLALIDMLIHYHVDWTKVQLGHHWQLTPSDKTFWTLIGVDQLLHGLTYVALVALALNYF